MEPDDVKNIVTLAEPLTKAVLDTFLAPKFQEIRASWTRKKKPIDDTLEKKFGEYLNQSYIKNAVLNTLAFKRQQVLLNEVYIPLSLHCEDDNETTVIDVFNENLFQDCEKLLITDTAGMGKSTISKKLFISCVEQNKGIPILIELRRLSGSKDIVAEILEQLNPINDQINKQLILDLIKQGDFIFFFDGFDEIELSERSRVTQVLQQFIAKSGNNRFLLTSRPEDALASFGDFRKLQIKPLKPEEAYELLRRYDQYGKLSKLLISKIKEPRTFKNIQEYLTNPLLVSLLFTAFEHKQSIPFKKHIFYRQVFDALFESHDLSKGDSFERIKISGLGTDEFHRVLRILGYLCLADGNKIEFTRDELNQIVQKAIDYCDDLKLKPADFIKDLLITVPLFTNDGIYFKWAHKSLQEYFAAQFIYLDAKKRQKDVLEKMCFHVQNQIFINTIDLYDSIDPKGFREIVIYKLLQDYFEFIKSSYKEFSGKDKVERQCFAFGFKLVLANFPMSLRRNPADDLKFWKMLEKRFPESEKRMSITIFGEDNEKDFSYIMVPEIPKPRQTLIDYLATKGTGFIKKMDMRPKVKTVDLRLPYGKLIDVTDRKNAFINKKGNFRKTNEIIKHFLGQSRINIIDSTKASKTLNEIRKAIKKSRDDDFILSF